MARALQKGLVVHQTRGFTLVEMMIVVAIVGILATLAVVGYRKMILSSHVSEATNMVNNIRAAQEAYHAETLQYANISTSVVTGPFYPQATPVGNLATAWGSPNGDAWSVLPVHVDGPVRFGYATTAGAAGSPPSDGNLTINGQAMAMPTPSPTDWFMIGATCDLDQHGAPNTQVYAMSWTNQTFVSNEGM